MSVGKHPAFSSWGRPCSRSPHCLGATRFTSGRCERHLGVEGTCLTTFLHHSTDAASQNPKRDMLITHVINWDQNYGFQPDLSRSPCPSAVPVSTNQRSVFTMLPSNKVEPTIFMFPGKQPGRRVKAKFSCRRGKDCFVLLCRTAYIAVLILYSYFRRQIKTKMKLRPKLPPFFSVGVADSQSHQLE